MDALNDVAYYDDIQVCQLVIMREYAENEWNKTKESAKSGWEAAKDKYNEEDNKTTIEQKDKK